GSNYVTNQTNISISGAGFEIMNDLILNSPPVFLNFSIGEEGFVFVSEINLIPASTKTIFCESVIFDPDGTEMTNVSAEFFDSTYSFFGDSDSNRIHYSNSSCLVDSNYGNSNETSVSCAFDALYYTNSGNWSCNINVNDGFIGAQGFNETNLNPLLAIGVDSVVDFGNLNTSDFITEEVEVNVTNYGNMALNLSLSGYAVSEGDGFAMSCFQGNISIDYQKYNLTASNLGEISFGNFDGLYRNLSSLPVVNIFNLDSRQDDLQNDAIKPTYWRIYAPYNVGGNCSGNIVFGATQMAG
ncbi:hypothetical protein COU60_04770, partial [Candidatus Pacearchaeota archaeon CG10_big_fil_rev_8_21_14_0_10_34_76]